MAITMNTNSCTWRITAFYLWKRTMHYWSTFPTITLKDLLEDADFEEVKVNERFSSLSEEWLLTGTGAQYRPTSINIAAKGADIFVGSVFRKKRRHTQSGENPVYIKYHIISSS